MHSHGLFIRATVSFSAHFEQKLECANTGKPWAEVRYGDVPKAIEHIRYTCGWADKMHSTASVREGHSMGFTSREGVGVVGT